MSKVMPTSILIIGSTGPAGQAIAKELSDRPNPPTLHAFCRDPSKLKEDPAHNGMYSSIVKGDATIKDDLVRAIDETEVDTIIVAVGKGHYLGKQSIRTDNAKALISALHSDPRFDHIRVAVLSSQGAGPTKIVAGYGIGLLIGYMLRNVMKDHTKQEKLLRSNIGKNSLLIVRPVSLTEGKPPAKEIVEFGNTVKAPKMTIDRSDVARFMVKEMFNNGWGEAFNICGVNKKKY
mmetsp:Transcript_32245/g.45859  ORF Transcript_32245/g.45859 Transcript_32245/m.45859 type:complete len:234 (+) Transcript_32245:151-852(+)|eukprot:CAMPEP_0202455624 /NCGR_PEP_ID=MMETSP1360-20130828/13103_1 /ASSEMBLY_ACC=CAM_ASM_000848 /TAXON_ID=515479 /ORGANISM="Licmophora paradoxa, Strain CCMP2313" /LENGTH=233 /DNA_ID=CAMNT_0049075243 /DNA_START=140 /DNA_END=841 /DNA_ORIENTATION=+